MDRVTACHAPRTHAETPSVTDIVRRAMAVCDPDGSDELVTDFMLAYEDRDEPAEFGDDLPEDIALFLKDAGVSA